MSFLQQIARALSNFVGALSGRNHRETMERLEALEGHCETIVERVAKMDARLSETVDAKTRKLRVRVDRIQRDVRALLRQRVLERSELEHPHSLQMRRFGLMSQNEEDGIIFALAEQAGTVNRTFVEIGCGVNGGNCGFLANELGWGGLMVDADEERVRRAKAKFGRRVQCISAMVTRENVNDLIRDAGLEGEIDLLSIDIDGNDYWVWDAIEACYPRIVVIEYNALFGADRALIVPYAPDFDRHSGNASIYYGASLAALTQLGESKGYRLVVTESEGVNAFFLRNDLAPEIPTMTAEDMFRARYKPIRRGVDLFAHIREHDLPVIDLN